MLQRVAFRTLLIVGLPAYIVFRVGAEWLFSKDLHDALPTVTSANVAATVYGAALTAGYAGLYQVAIQVPTSLADGDWPLVATIGGVASPSGVVLW